jgi:hypothetical protein
MNSEFDDGLSAEERAALAALAREKTPPPMLEERVVQSLKSSNLIRPARDGRRPLSVRVALGAAASLALVALGAIMGAWWASAPQRPETAEFLLVLREAAQEFQPATADEAMRRVREYTAWASEIRRKGLLVGAEKLKDEIRLMRTAAGRAVAETVEGPVENSIGGYFLIHARDYGQAIQIAEGCPHLKYGGTIEIRQIDSL